MKVIKIIGIRLVIICTILTATYFGIVKYNELNTLSEKHHGDVMGVAILMLLEIFVWLFYILIEIVINHARKNYLTRNVLFVFMSIILISLAFSYLIFFK